MDNFDQESGQQQYANDSGLNVFSKIYGYMALAVFVSAISAYLTMTVLRDLSLPLLHNTNCLRRYLCFYCRCL